MSVRDRVDESELDVPGPDAPQELPPVKASPERRPEAPDDPRTPGQTRADLRQQTDSGWNPNRKFDVPREELAKFDLERAGLSAMSVEEADNYVEQNRDARPWLAMTDKASPEARRIIAALDAAGGHAHIRHEGWVTEEANERRAAYREDPAQLDPEKRHLAVDGLRQGDQPHACRTTATRIADPDAFAVGYARAVEHPKVREALEAAFDPGKKPREVAISITDLLGEDGDRYCTGWRLESGDGTMKAAVARRDDWIAAKVAGREPDVSQPTSAPVSTFRGGEIVVAFTRNYSQGRYEIVSMFPRPAQLQAAGEQTGIS